MVMAYPLGVDGTQIVDIWYTEKIITMIVVDAGDVVITLKMIN